MMRCVISIGNLPTQKSSLLHRLERNYTHINYDIIVAQSMHFVTSTRLRQ